MSEGRTDHRTNRLLAALEPDDFAALRAHLEIVPLTRGQVLYDVGDPIRFSYFPHDAIVSLVNVMEDGGSVEVAVFGREGVFGLLAEMLGVQRSSVSMVTRTLQTAGLIQQARGSITVTYRAGLEEVACECYGKIRRIYEHLLPGTYPQRQSRSEVTGSGGSHNVV